MSKQAYSRLSAGPSLCILLDETHPSRAGFIAWVCQALSDLKQLKLVLLKSETPALCTPVFFESLLKALAQEYKLEIQHCAVEELSKQLEETPWIPLPERFSYASQDDELEVEWSQSLQHQIDELYAQDHPLWETGLEVLLTQYLEKIKDTKEKLAEEGESLLQGLQHNAELSLGTPVYFRVLNFLDQPERLSWGSQKPEHIQSAYHKIQGSNAFSLSHLQLALLGRRGKTPNAQAENPALQILSQGLTQVPLLELCPAVDNACVAIIMPSYNRVAKLRAAVAAIQAQSYTDWKLYLCNDGSTDQTHTQCQEWAEKDSRIRYLPNEQNRGVNYSLQKLVDATTEEWLVYCSDDHLLHPQFLEQTVAAFHKYPWIAMAASSFEIHNEDTNEKLFHGPYQREPSLVQTQKELQRAGLICPSGPACLYRKSLLKHWAEKDIWFKDLSYAGWDYLLNNLLMAHYDVAYVPERLLIMLDAQQTESKRHDHSYELIYLMSQLLQDYKALFGPKTYPGEIAERYLSVRYHVLAKKYEELLGMQSAEDVDLWVDEQRKVWKAFVQLKQQVHKQSSHQVPLLIKLDNPYQEAQI